jgi:hypothetical protein
MSDKFNAHRICTFIISSFQKENITIATRTTPAAAAAVVVVVVVEVIIIIIK